MVHKPRNFRKLLPAIPNLKLLPADFPPLQQEGLYDPTNGMIGYAGSRLGLSSGLNEDIEVQRG